jgi:hypothetical protein
MSQLTSYVRCRFIWGNIVSYLLYKLRTYSTQGNILYFFCRPFALMGQSCKVTYYCITGKTIHDASFAEW